MLVQKKKITSGASPGAIDYEKLNVVALQDAYPLLHIDESLDTLTGSRYSSTLDLTSGYFSLTQTFRRDLPLQPAVVSENARCCHLD